MSKAQYQVVKAPAVFGCGQCGEHVDVAIPVEVWLEIREDGGVEMRAKVDQDVDYHQPLWDHDLLKHGPKL